MSKTSDLFEVKVCKKLIQAGGKSFDKLVAVIENPNKDSEDKVRFLDYNCSNDVKKRVEKEMAINDIEYPIVIKLNDDEKSYFIVEEENYSEKTGKTYINKKLVITDFVSIEKAPAYKPAENKPRLTIGSLFS